MRKSSSKGSIQIIRAYDLTPQDKGYRVLVDRLWPRGLSKDKLSLDEWAKDIAPSTELRHQFHDQPDHWKEFQKHYAQELKAHADEVKSFVDRIKGKSTLLIYGSHDIEHNNAVALRGYLKRKFKV